jgi:hypothetical protein
MGETYFCKGRKVLLKDLTKTCLGVHYLADNKNIQDRCKFSIRGAQEKIFHLESNTYVVYSLGKISTNHVCPKAKTISAVQISSDQIVRINPSCTSGPWTTSSRPMTARRSRSTLSGWTGPGRWDSFSNNQRTRWSPRHLPSFGPKSQANSMPRSCFTSCRP